MRFETLIPTIVSVPNARKFRPGFARRDAKRLDVPALQLFDLLRRLPEKQIGADRGSEDRDHGGRVRGVEYEVRNERVLEGRFPWHAGHEDDPDISEQRQCRPFQYGRISRIAQEGFKQNADDAEHDRIRLMGTADQQAERRSHGAEIGAEIDDIGREKEEDDRTQEPGRIMASDVFSDAVARDATDPRADGLNDDHQRQTEHHRPGEPISELRADLAISPDAARIIIRGTRDQARP